MKRALAPHVGEMARPHRPIAAIDLEPRAGEPIACPSLRQSGFAQRIGEVLEVLGALEREPLAKVG